jgi:hypothetical protein
MFAMEKIQVIQQFVMEEVFAKILILVLVIQHTLEMIVKLQFALDYLDLLHVQDQMALVLLLILAHAFLDSLVINAKSLFASLNSLMILQFVMDVEDVLLQTHVYALPHTKEINVKIQFVMELFQLKQVLFVVEMVLVSLQTIAIAQLDILEVFVTFTHAMENYPMILQLATLVETVSEKNNVSATMDTLEHIVT